MPGRSLLGENSIVKAPEILTLDDTIKFDDTADVVVIGLGAAGASAAIEARTTGADVLVIERASSGGGSTQFSGAYIYLGGGTRVQKANGLNDTVEDMYNYLMAMTPNPNEKKIRLYCDNSLAHFDWIEAQGIKFNDGFYPHKTVEHSTADGLAWTGNEKVWPYYEKATPMPRGHKVTNPEGQQELGQGGLKLIQTLMKSAEAKGIRFEYDSGVKHLIADKSGRIVGVKYRQFDTEKYVRARRGVVIATGGFAMNKELVAECCPIMGDERITIVGGPNADGSGILLGVSAGGEMVNPEGCLITAPIYPPASLLKGILVNKQGKRFVAEDSYHGRSTTGILKQPDMTAFLICDNAIFARPEMGGQPLIDAWETVPEMERDLGIPEGELQKTLAAYNENAAKGLDPDFHKYKDWLQPLTEAPFAALDCSLGKAFYGAFTLGGLKTSENAEVLNQKTGKPIPGLYAAGACASNIAQDSAGYSSGTCVGESTYFGRRAGAHAATQKAAA